MAKIVKIPIVGRKYGRLTIVEYLGKDGYSRTRVTARCDCGTIKAYFLNNLQRKAHTQSCGCLRKKVSIARFVTHGMRRHPLYRIWADIKTRCNNPNVPHYDRYGGRGIQMCEEWLRDPAAFIYWALANGWKKGLKVDKDIKVKGNLIYGPEFCSITTNKENSRHTRRTRLLTHNGETKCAADWADAIGIERSKFHQRVKKCGYNLTKYFELWGRST